MTAPPSPILFLHGGPGLNSRVEESFLAPLLEARGVHARFWNEPRVPQDGVGALTNWRYSAETALRQMGDPESRIHVVAHSFGSGVAVQLAERNPEVVARLTLIAPAFGLWGAFRNVLCLAQSDFAQTSPSRAEVLGRLLPETRDVFDDAMTAGFRLALEDSALLTHYFHDVYARNHFFAACAELGAGMDLESFFGVGRDLRSATWPPSVPVSIPTTLIFGQHDPICPRSEQERLVCPFVREFATREFARSAHYPHLEQTELFLECLLESPRKNLNPDFNRIRESAPLFSRSP